MGISTLLLNAFIIIICILSYQVFWLDKTEKKARNNILISFLSSVAIVLCMTFPIHLHDGYIYDLRFIPILLVLLYGNTRSVICISIVYIAYRFYLGGNGFFSSVIIYTVITAITTILRYFLPIYFRRKKVLFNTLLLLICTSSFSIFAIMNQIEINGKIEAVFIGFLINYVVVNAFTGFLSVYLVEGMIEKFKMKEKIQRAEKFYTASELAASIAHEIHNPLTTVYGFTQLFREIEISKTSQDEYLKIMLMELEKVQLIIDNYLSLTKPQHTIKKLLNISCIFREVTNIISPLAFSYNVEIKRDIPACLYINANPEKLKQCLTNILQNGIEAMKDGGVLQIRAQKIKGNIVIDIIDSGIGMSRKEIKRIATPFYSTKEKGTGLGTMIAYSIIRELNGDIEIESTKGKGTCFSIIIPC
ncbi:MULTISPECIES: ATP-binding protein [unclassified Bacillus (in: firmicutes)]|uniref:ATP-binding protein n=1 Tax=unclassified Bacillus (in: firmicutes) TaxID=185979 RepID=UPI0008F1A3B6|nr:MULTISPECIES: ATP-binding protein [unclassified Bacillus (in: firmicutes)]SFJ76458.1 two-component system, sporulation sensor kinase B [Bacillus sp. 71mf]SFT16653.1 two-component system, sporulation sensor kinase B [Bacillus sp. 103mf]